LDKVVSIKRKAQRFVQSGDLGKAVAEYERLLEVGALDPYDYLQVGDLLTRLRRMDDAVLRYRDAIAAYERVGLYKNAVAVCKKLLRVRPDAYDILKTLGGLYAQEGLQTDAIFYYLQFLNAAPPDREAEGIREVGVRLLALPLPSAEVAYRVIDVMHTAGCDAAGARPLYDLGLAFEARGLTEWGQGLKSRASQIVANVEELEPTATVEAPRSPAGAEAMLPPSPEEAAWAPALPADFGQLPAAGSIEDEDDADAAEMPGVLEIDGDAALDLDSPAAHETPSRAADPGYDFGMIDIAPPSAAADAPAKLSVPESLSRGSNGHAPAGIDPTTIESSFAEEFAPGDPDELCAEAERHLEEGNTSQALTAWLAAARAAFNARQSRRAEDIYLNMVARDPNHLEALQGLCEIAHINGERQKMVRFGCELGDVLLAREMYPEAKLEFERVLQFDPSNEKARARVNRLNSIEGVDKITAAPLAPVASEVMGAMVTVRGEPVQTQTVNDLSEILSEFQKAMASQVGDDDAQSHYDLGMTYLEMGMHEQAIASFQAAAKSEALAGQALEMLARVQIEAGQPESAIETVDTALAQGVPDAHREAALYAWRGAALEAIGYATEALAEFQRALERDPALAPAREALRRLAGRAADGAAA
jgi:tetratricopeptide (TPR) repeat protein